MTEHVAKTDILMVSIDQFLTMGGDLKTTGKVSENMPEVVYVYGVYSQWMVMLPAVNACPNKRGNNDNS